MKDTAKVVAYILALVLFIGGSAWVWTSAPCGLWTFAKAGEMPARCLVVSK
ncbi:hypothetical protein [Streptomyces sp. Isolate_219]|uniref:hypothetical protein n=1 Tax=Streptomyces sp. Isolate_219 TaxID=2950110 RepID=UPI0021C73944|nr:hypothetical protein [Streptomyces sp. Isolate_219]MCR8576451.1 hypothetical protein [Streptomyces sp. Isolate_219]